MAGKIHEVGSWALVGIDALMSALDPEPEVASRQGLDIDLMVGVPWLEKPLVVSLAVGIRARPRKRRLVRWGARAWPGVRDMLAGLWAVAAGEPAGEVGELVNDDGVPYAEQEKVDGVYRRRAEFDAPDLVKARRELAAVLGLVFAPSNGATRAGEPRGLIDDTHIDTLLRRLLWSVGDGELSSEQLVVVARVLAELPDTVSVDSDLLEAVQAALNSERISRSDVRESQREADLVQERPHASGVAPDQGHGLRNYYGEPLALPPIASWPYVVADSGSQGPANVLKLIKRRLGSTWKRQERAKITLGLVASREVAMIMNARELVETLAWLVAQVVPEGWSGEKVLVVDGAAWTWTVMDAVRLVLGEDEGWSVLVVEANAAAAEQTKVVTAQRMLATGLVARGEDVSVEVVSQDRYPGLAVKGVNVLVVMGEDARCKDAVLEHQEFWHGRHGEAPDGWCVWSRDGQDPFEKVGVWEEAIVRADDRHKAG